MQIKMQAIYHEVWSIDSIYSTFEASHRYSGTIKIIIEAERIELNPWENVDESK